jgi:hypothetical protein
MEDISSFEKLEEENQIIIKRFPEYECFSQKRLTFWKSSFARVQDIEAQTDRNFLGYVILKKDSVNHEKLIPKWHIFESVLRPPFGDNVFIPRLSSFQVRCSSKVVTVDGILFCGQDGAFKTCAFTSLRSLSSYMLDRDVSYNEIMTVIPSCDPSLGLSLDQISQVLRALEIEHNVFNPSQNEQPPINELIQNTISARSGVLLAFTIGERKFGHLLFIYGYTLNPLSVQFTLGAAYFPDNYNHGLYNSIAPWVDNFICTDDNFGPYCYLPPNFLPIRKPEILITALPSNIKFGGIEATAIAFTIFRHFASSLEEVKNNWLLLLINYLERNQVVFNSVLMEPKEYIDYLRTVTDWENNGEDAQVLSVFQSTLQESKLWIIEFTIPEFMRSYFKLGEIVLSTENAISFSEKTIWNNFITARVPSLYVLSTGNDEISTLKSNLKSQTPFFQGGESRRSKMASQYEYQVALSFAGEDRAYAEELAEILSSKNISVFYDKYEKAQLWGKDLYQHLQKVYRDMAQFCVVFLSNSYAEKLWTKHELKQAQTRAFKESEEYILPIKIDSTEIPGINETIGYIDLREDNISTVADLILQKLGI